MSALLSSVHALGLDFQSSQGIDFYISSNNDFSPNRSSKFKLVEIFTPCQLFVPNVSRNDRKKPYCSGLRFFDWILRISSSVLTVQKKIVEVYFTSDRYEKVHESL